MSREARSDTPFVDFAAGSTILHEGEVGSALFIIEAGKVGIERNGSPPQRLAELGPGEFFGEMAILQDQPNSANAVARTAVRALKIDAAAFHAVLRENAEVGVHIMRRLVLRLRAVEQRSLELELRAGAANAAPAPIAASPAPPAARDAAPAAAPLSAPASLPSSGRAASPAAPAGKAAVDPRASTKPAAAEADATAVVAPVAAAKGAGMPEASSARAAPAPMTTGDLAAEPAPAAAPTAAPSATASYFLRHADGALALPTGKSECLIGRPDPATGAIPEVNLGPLDLARSLSRRHARLLVGAGGISLREEPGVSNGTWVNGERLAAGQTVVLKPGDRLRFGAIELELGIA